MRYLLDTHALVWWWLTDPKLSHVARSALHDRGNTVLVSAATAYEITNKVRLGKLSVMKELVTIYDVALTQDGFGILPLENHHARHAGLLEGEHRDPFDRMIAAQALIENLTVVTCDPAISQFGCKVLW